MKENTKEEDHIGIERIKEMMDYDPITGILTWKIDRPGQVKKGDKVGSMSGGYLTTRLYKNGVSRTYSCHRLAWAIYYGKFPADKIDHQNRIRTDNRIENLREATQQQNCCNQPKRTKNASGYKGVSKIKLYGNKRNKRWLALIWVDYKMIHLGYYFTPEDAARAYNEASIKYHGEYGSLNIIPDETPKN